MNILGPASDNDISSFMAHAWQLGHQETAFSARPFTDTTDSVASFCGAHLGSVGHTVANLQPGLKVQGEDITVLFLNQALEYFQKSLYNFVVQYLLAYRGLSTWAEITNYYSSFFSIHALLCLQGRTLTRLTLGAVESRCHVFALNFLTHEYVICKKGINTKGGEHAAPWNRYYEVYDKYTHPVSDFEVIYKRAYVPDPIDELSSRHQLNYALFQGFQEIIDHRQMEEFKTSYLAAVASPGAGTDYDACLVTLRALVTDPFFQYFARVALRLLFAADIFKRLILVNPNLKVEWERRLPLWRHFSFVSFSEPPKNIFEDLPHLLGQV
jgi:hypothetical protein